MRRKQLIIFGLVTMLLGVVTTSSLTAQDVKSTLFKEASAALQKAKEARADILAPKNFGKAMEFYSEAEEDFNKGKNLEEIKKKLRAAVSYFQKASESTELAEVTFVSSLKARNDAHNAQAANFAKELWEKAEEKFEEAARDLEEGDVNDAKKKSAEAEELYRQAELEAIKVTYLKDTWQLLEQAEKMDVKDRAPKTLKRAQTLAKKAEKELSENRYDTDLPRSLAQQAKYEAKHAIYLSEKIKKLKESDRSFEDLILAAEEPLEKIAGTLDVVAEFDAGLGETTDKIIDIITTYQDSLAKLSQKVSEREQRITMLGKRIEELEEKVGGIEEEKSLLAQRMEAQARIREKFASAEKMFTREEAQVLRDVNDVIIRLVGLNFDVGKSTIKPEYFGLLTKVQKAINIFPEATLTIEGHTDSHGSDQLNMKLSQERAEAVRQYILANMGLEPTRIKAVGYGESKPIANNETPEGRAKNRRIDVIIHPQIPGTY